MFKSGKHRDEKKSNYSQEDTDKSDKESLYGVLVFSHLNSTSDRFTSSLEPLLGNWIAKESYLGGKSSQFLIDLNSILLLLCHSRREQFTIDRLQSSSKKSAKFSTHNFQLFLMTFYLNLSPLWKRNFLKRQILDENFLSTSDEERNEKGSEEEKKFSDYWNSCLMPSLLLFLLLMLPE